MNRTRLLGLTALLSATAIVAHFAFAQTAPTTAPSADATARATLEAYAKAINDRNADAVGGYWAENAEHISDEGIVTSGKAAIAAMFKKTLADNPKLAVKLTPSQSRMLGNDVLLIDGVADVTTGDGTDTSRFESLWVRNGNSWQISRVRELADAPAGSDSNYDVLKQLEWIVGDWTAQTAGYSVAVNAKWTKNRNFLMIEQTVTADGKEAITVVKIIGYDPVRGQLRTWVFDSDGGFGGALMSRSGNNWVEESEAITRTGGEATATHSATFIDANTFEWSSTNRQLDDKPLPDLKIKYTRKPAAK